MKNKTTIVVIDDEMAIRRLLRTALEGSGYQVLEEACGSDGLRCVAQHQPDIVLLDLGLPDMEGLEVLGRLREWTDIPVIVITVRDEPEEKIAALDSGADDFVTKPFHTGELLARIRSVTKRLHPSDQEACVNVGSLHIDFLERRILADGSPIDLTPIEYKILQTLARHQGKIVTKSSLLTKVWGPASTSTDEHLRVHLAAIRRKLKPAGCEGLIRTETGVGYRLAG